MSIGAVLLWGLACVDLEPPPPLLGVSAPHASPDAAQSADAAAGDPGDATATPEPDAEELADASVEDATSDAEEADAGVADDAAAAADVLADADPADTAAPDTAVPDAAVPDSAVPDTAVALADAASDTETLREGLVGYWTFDEAAGTTAADSSGRGNHGQHVNGPTISTLAAPVTFANPRSLAFSQSARQGVLVPDSLSLSLTGHFTLAAWIRPTVDGTFQPGIIEKWQWDDVAQAPTNGYFLRLDAQERPKVAIYGASTVEVVGPAAVALNRWTHVAATFDGAQLRLFVDGVERASAAATAPPTDGPAALEIGGSSLNRVEGQLDDVRIYERALSASEMAALAARSSP